MSVATHPLDPLTKDEISKATMIFKKHSKINGRIKFETIELDEPKKTIVNAFKSGDSIGVRQARVHAYEEGKRGVHVAVISLGDDGNIIKSKYLKDVNPMIAAQDFEAIEQAIKQDSRFIKALEKRGIKDMDLVCVDPWASGSVDEGGKHVSHGFCWVRNSEFDNLYAHPIEGVNPVVDITTMEVIRVDDHGVVPVRHAEHNYEAKFQPHFRKDIKPLNILQPSGVGFKIDGRMLSWQKWKVHIGWTGREGLVLSKISFDGRSIIYKINLAEMVVPYGSSAPNHCRKNVFDIGEYGIGFLVTPLSLGCDCVGSIRYMDATMHDVDGNPMIIPNAICIHEEDAGVLWKHRDFRTEVGESRRARRLVISSTACVGNYEYISYWNFYQDGTIEFDMRASGIINTSGQGGKFGTEVAPGVFGHIHQHIFNARIDWEIDGVHNSVEECNTKSLPYPHKDNPHGNAYYVEKTLLETEKSAQRKKNNTTMRYWNFFGRKKNYLGQLAGYKLYPRDTVQPFIHPNSPSGSRAQFIFKDLWVTPYEKEERYPAGLFVHGTKPGKGLPMYTRFNRNISDRDIVAWYNFGLHHLPRPEDFPVQPVISSGFTLMSNCFFDRNPTLDVPPATDNKSFSVDEQQSKL